MGVLRTVFVFDSSKVWVDRTSVSKLFLVILPNLCGRTRQTSTLNIVKFYPGPQVHKLDKETESDL